MADHSPAPWEVTLAETPGLPTISIRSGQALVTRVMARDRDLDRAIADAQLMAAAPKLTAMLRQLLQLHIAHHNNPYHAAARHLLAQVGAPHA